MARTSQTYRGTIRGKTIELSEDTGLPEGQEVTVTVQPISNASGFVPQDEPLRRSFGAWSDDARELDEYLNWARTQRRQDREERS